MTENSKSLWYVETPVGKLGLAEDGVGVTDIFFCEPSPAACFHEEKTPLLRRTAAELEEYFAGKRKSFDLPLSLSGTAFQLADWAALQTIPYGETRSYAQLAAMLENPRACRAVGLANSRNPVSIIVPCHRVIAADGSLGGYSAGLSAKRFLLALEKKYR